MVSGLYLKMSVLEQYYIFTVKRNNISQTPETSAWHPALGTLWFNRLLWSSLGPENFSYGFCGGERGLGAKPPNIP